MTFKTGIFLCIVAVMLASNAAEDLTSSEKTAITAGFTTVLETGSDTGSFAAGSISTFATTVQNIMDTRMPFTIHVERNLLHSRFIVRVQPTSPVLVCPGIDLVTESGTSTIAAICVFRDTKLALPAILDTHAGQMMVKAISSIWIDSMSLAATAISCRISGCSIKVGVGEVQDVFATITDAARLTHEINIEQVVLWTLNKTFCLLRLPFLVVFIISLNTYNELTS
eukprot:gene4163-20350_t